MSPPLVAARRWLVAGNSGSGKTTLARRIAAAIRAPYTEIDAMHWHAGWTPNPRFADDVSTLAAGDAWVTEWQYDLARPLLVARAEVLVWLDLPAAVILGRVTRRTVLRRVRRQELWNGNHEAPLRTVFTSDEHVLRWAYRTLGVHEDRVRAALLLNPHLRLVRLRSQGDVRRLLTRLT